MQTTLCIGDIFFSVHSEASLSLPENFIPFVCDAVASPNFSVTVSKESLAPQKGTLLFQTPGRHVWIHNNSLVFCHFLPDGRELCRTRISEDFYSASITLAKDSPLSFGAALNFIPFGIAFLPHEGLFFHAATVVHDEKAYIFTAPSGGGKSTHAALWQETTGARLLNGDRILIRKKDGIYLAYGLPVAGSSFVFLNERAPIAAVTLLKKAPQNLASRASEKDIAAMMEQAELPLFHPLLAEKALNIFSDLSQNIPFFSLACRPDTASVQTLRKLIYEVNL
ncbi:MAG: hypothetical protein II359_00200 [Clostridia bacterium]|nr:hypothetical protein [Clostridia bacterium]